MSASDENPIDINNLTLDDLKHEYLKLSDTCKYLKKEHEQDRQQIYELKRNLQTATAAEVYLTQELEQVSSVQKNEINAVQQKFQHELDEVKRKSKETESLNVSLEQNIDELRKENERLQTKLLQLENVPQQQKMPKSTEQMEKESKLENENLDLLAKIDEYHGNMAKYLLAIAEREKQIEILKDQVECLEENLQSKREELEEKSTLLESTQEQMLEINAKLALLTSKPDNENRKGNSLFAEVDDQRQAMRQLLAAQKKNYMQMKRIYNESEHEIRRLKRENVAMHTELRACTSIFLNADHTYKEKLNERMLHLSKENEELEKKLAWTQDKLISVANDKGINWLDSMLSFCKQETEELKSQLRSCRIQKGILEENFRNTQQELAKWRFEALKSRCIIIDRETLLEENNIKFKTFHPIDFRINQQNLESEEPKIGGSHKEDAHGSLITEPQKLGGSHSDSIVDCSVSNYSVMEISSSRVLGITNVPEGEHNNSIIEYEGEKQIRSPPITQDENPQIGVLPDSAKASDNELNLKMSFCNDQCNSETVSPIFQIYEDTTEVVPTVKKQVLTEKNSDESIKEEMIYLEEKTPEKLKIVQDIEHPHNGGWGYQDVRHAIKTENDVQCPVQIDETNKENSTSPFRSPQKLKQSSPSLETFQKAPYDCSQIKQEPMSSILIKNRDFPTDSTFSKSVKFDGEIIGVKSEDKTHKAFAKQTRTKSNIIIKKIVVNSKTEN